jgi:ABC-type transport system involved in multi-copper enzyme maturation permease subunit
MSERVAIARMDFYQLIRSRYLWAGAITLTVLVSSPWITGNYAYARIDDPLVILLSPYQILAPMVAAGLGFGAIAAERSSNRLRLLFGEGASRADVVVAKCASRSVLTISLLLLAALVGLVLIAVNQDFAFVPLIGTLLLIMLVGATWLSIAIGVSCSVPSTHRSVSVFGGLFLLLGPAWNVLGTPLFSFVFGTSQTGSVLGPQPLAYVDGPTWYVFLTRLSPLRSFEGARYYVPRVLDSGPSLFPGDLAHIPNLFGIGMLLVWTIVPVLIGFRQFQRADLD